MRRTLRQRAVVHVSSAHPASDPRIHLREAASLVEAGYDVTLIAVRSDVDMPSTGVRVITLPQRARWSRMTRGTADAVLRALRSRAGIVHLHDPELAWAVPLLRLLGRVVVYDAHEDLPQQVHNKPYLPARLVPAAARVARAVVRWASLSDQVIAATETIATTFPPHKVTVVRNYPVLRDAESTEPLDRRPPNVGYLGAISTDRGALQMVDSLSMAAFPDGWKAVLAGSVSPAGLLTTLQSRPGWHRVEYHGKLSPDAARDLLAQCRIGLVLLQRSQAYLDSLPTKMFEYFASGIPVVASDFPLWRSIIETHSCGVVVDETDPHAIAAAVARYAEDPDLLARHGANARQAALNHLNWRTQSGRLLAAYDALGTRG